MEISFNELRRSLLLDEIKRLLKDLKLQRNQTIITVKSD